MTAFVPPKLERWLIAHAPHVWAVHAPSLMVIAILCTIPAFVASAIALLFGVFLGGCLTFSVLVFVLILMTWFLEQPPHTMPDGGRVTRSAADDVRVALVAMLAAVFLGCSIIGPVLLAGYFQFRGEATATQAAEVARGLLVASSYAQRDTDVASIRKALRRNSGLLEGAEVDPMTWRRRAQEVIRAQNRAALTQDMEQFERAMRIIAPKDAADYTRLPERVADCLSAWRTGTKETCYPIYIANLSFSIYGDSVVRTMNYHHWSSSRGVGGLAIVIGIIAIWFGATLAWTTDVGVALWFGFLSLALVTALAEDAAMPYVGHIHWLVASGLWLSFSVGVIGLLFAPFRRAGFNLMLTGAFCATAMVCGAILWPSNDMDYVRGHAAAVFIAYLLMVPICDYLRKRVVSAPST